MIITRLPGLICRSGPKKISLGYLIFLISRYMFLNQNFVSMHIPERKYMKISEVFSSKIPILTQNASDPRRWRLSWSGLLVLLSGSSIITISQRTIPSVEEIPNQIAGINTAKTGEEILFLLIKGSIVTIDRLITDAEEQLVFLEYQKVDSRPPNFLKMVYRIRKELGNMISWLLHTREGLQILIEGSSIRGR